MRLFGWLPSVIEPEPPRFRSPPVTTKSVKLAVDNRVSVPLLVNEPVNAAAVLFATSKFAPALSVTLVKDEAPTFRKMPPDALSSRPPDTLAALNSTTEPPPNASMTPETVLAKEPLVSRKVAPDSARNKPLLD